MRVLLNYIRNCNYTYLFYADVVSQQQHACANNRSLQLKFKVSLPISHCMAFTFDLLPAPGSFRSLKKYTLLMLSSQ